MKYITTYFWHSGSSGRKNEDSLSLQCVLFKRQEAALLVVCDGIGGLDAGEQSSGFAAEQLTKWFWEKALDFVKRRKWKNVLVNSAIRQFMHIQEELEWFQKKENLRSGTTCTMALVCRGEFVVVHCGDSRAYLLGRKEQCLTRDHTLDGKLLRCLGDQGFQKPDIYMGKIRQGEILLLCTDGFCREAPTGFFQESLWKQNGCLKEKVECVGRFLLAHGERDNLTAVALQAEGR